MNPWTFGVRVGQCAQNSALETVYRGACDDLGAAGDGKQQCCVPVLDTDMYNRRQEGR